MRLRVCILDLAIVWAVACAAGAQERELPTPAEAVKYLETEGLLRNGSAWISRTEARLRHLLEGHEAMERRFHKAELARWEMLYARQSQRLAEEAKKEVRDVLRFRTLEIEQTLARTQYERYAKLLKAPAVPRMADVKDEDLRRKVVESIEARSAFALSILEMRQLTDAQILASYGPIRQNAEIGMSLAAMGPLARLGPLKRYDPLRKEADKASAEVLTDVVPMYRNEGRYCITGLAGDRMSVTFEYAPENDLSLLGEDAARQLGIELTEETPRVTLSIGERKLDAWRVKIPLVRFGRHALRDIPAAVLPKKEAKTSPRLGRSAWNGFEVELQVDRLEFHLHSHAEGSSQP